MFSVKCDVLKNCKWQFSHFKTVSTSRTANRNIVNGTYDITDRIYWRFRFFVASVPFTEYRLCVMKIYEFMCSVFIIVSPNFNFFVPKLTYMYNFFIVTKEKNLTFSVTFWLEFFIIIYLQFSYIFKIFCV